MEYKYFKNDAKQIVDAMFDTKLLKEDVSRDTMNAFEELIQYMLETKFNSYNKTAEFIRNHGKSIKNLR